MSHDQNFKNLILDYPLAAVSFFAEAEASGVDAGVRLNPIRQEQLQERLGERFRELDVPLRLEWPDGRREALLFVFEEETNPGRFSVHRLAHYCLDLAELCAPDRVVPVVNLPAPGPLPLPPDARRRPPPLPGVPLSRLCAVPARGQRILREPQHRRAAQPAEHGL